MGVMTEFTVESLALTHSKGATLEQRNCVLYRLVVDGVTVEYRRDNGSIGGTQAWVMDFDEVENKTDSA